MPAAYTLNEIVSRLGGELIGDENIFIDRVASLANAQTGQISFLSDTKHLAKLSVTKASAIILAHQHRDLTSITRILTDNPYAYFAKVSDLLNPKTEFAPGIAPTAVIDPSAVIPDSCTVMAHAVIEKDVVLGEHVVIGQGCVVGEGVKIGQRSVLQARVSVYHHCELGDRCVVASGVVIGADGFGYANDNGRWVKIPQVGRVMIGDDVEIGANTTIDRGALDDTVIERGVKLDNLIQIGHNCRIGSDTVIAGCVGVAGSAVIGRNCRIGGAAMILGHLEVADDITISPGSMITRSLVKAGTYTALMPFQAHEDWLKTAANIRHLGELTDRIRRLEKELASFKNDQQQI